MAKRRLGMIPWMALSLIILWVATEMVGAADKVPRMTKEELKSMMGNPDLVIVDVRAEGDWKNSDSKIQGAVREDPNKATKSWAEKYSKEKTIVLYCA